MDLWLVQVAVKMIDKWRLDEASLARVRREVALLKRLRHAHIVRLYQVIETDRLLYIVTELAANGEVFGAPCCPLPFAHSFPHKLFLQIRSITHDFFYKYYAYSYSFTYPYGG